MQTRIPFLLCLSLVLAVPAAAQTKKPEPSASGGGRRPTRQRKSPQFDDWTAATHEEGGQTVCYAFTRAAEFRRPACPGAARWC